MRFRILVAVWMVMAATTFAAKPRYVFLFIGDGMSTPQRMTAEEFARNAGLGPLAMNALPFQATARTCSATSLVTDSAAAATAIACGEKTYNGAIGVGTNRQSLVSVAETAHNAGKKVGIVTTVTITHATPAGFYAHRQNRNLMYQIALDLVASGFEYFAGGGTYNMFDRQDDPLYRGNVYDLAEKAGCRVVRGGRDALAAIVPDGRRTWFVACEDMMHFDIDLAFEPQPTLAEMTAKGVALLEGPSGFFMMVEGGKIDYAAHANDAATTLREVIALDDAVRVAVEFAGRHPGETLVVVTGDHETGGMSMGFAGTGYAFHMDRLAHQKESCVHFEMWWEHEIAAALDKGGRPDFAQTRKRIESSFGLVWPDKTSAVADDAAAGAKFAAAGDGAQGEAMALSAANVQTLEKAFADDIAAAAKRRTEPPRKTGDKPAKSRAHLVTRLAETIRRIMSAKAGIGWSSGAHTALPAMTTSQGPGAETLTGLIENSDLARRLKLLCE